MAGMIDTDLEALKLLRSDIRKLFPPGPVRDRWLARADELCADDQRRILAPWAHQLIGHRPRRSRHQDGGHALNGFGEHSPRRLSGFLSCLLSRSPLSLQAWRYIRRKRHK
jgi:hypothetical protein